ncbi:MAG: hypothetical protein ACE5MH_07825, partial [Terriglobia bacterium]
MRRCVVALVLVGLVAAGLARAAESEASRPRLILLEVDGLSPALVEALIDPDNPETLKQLPDPEGFRRAIQLWRSYTGRQDLVPNLRHYFFEQGVRAERMYSATVTLSSVAWSVIETGQPSVIKKHMSFSRQNGYLRSHLDGFRDMLELLVRDARKTNAVWTLDQAGVSLLPDAFNPLRVYTAPQTFHRHRSAEYAAGVGRRWLSGGQPLSRPHRVLAHHLSRRVTGMNYPDFGEDFLADHLGKMIRRRDFVGKEYYDYFSAVFSIIDHNHHIDPNPENLVFRMILFDRRLGRILTAVEKS